MKSGLLPHHERLESMSNPEYVRGETELIKNPLSEVPHPELDMSQSINLNPENQWG